MTRLHRLCLAFIAGFSTFIFSDRISASGVLCTIRRAVEYVVHAVALLSPAIVVDWRIIERLCSHMTRERLNVYGSNPRSTGSLYSPLI